LEKDVLVRLARDRQLVVYQHEGFWRSMDTFKEAREMAIFGLKVRPGKCGRENSRAAKRILARSSDFDHGLYWDIRLVAHKDSCDLGADVVGLIRDWIPQSELLRSGTVEQIKTVRGDIRDSDIMNRLFSEYEVDTCFHLAAQTIVALPTGCLFQLLKRTFKGLDCSGSSPAVGSYPRIIVASSDKAYGDHEVLPYDETAPLRVSTPMM